MTDTALEAPILISVSTMWTRRKGDRRMEDEAEVVEEEEEKQREGSGEGNGDLYGHKRQQ